MAIRKKKTAMKKAVAKKPIAKKAVKKTARKLTKKVAAKKTRKAAAPKVSKTKAFAARKATYLAMKKAKKMADRVREDDLYNGGPSFAAAQGHPTAESEAHNTHAPNPQQTHDEKARIEMLMGKNVHGHIAAQVRRNQGQRDNR